MKFFLKATEDMLGNADWRLDKARFEINELIGEEQLRQQDIAAAIGEEGRKADDTEERQLAIAKETNFGDKRRSRTTPLYSRIRQSE